MIDFLSLLKDTGVYKTVKGDKINDRLSHAYLVVSPDGENLIEYLKILAMLIACGEEDPCGTCKTCKLISANAFPDLFVYPSNGQTVITEDITDLIENSYIKPISCDKKIFIINKGESMNASAQNKLLKTLEEPPKNVHIIIGATSEYPLLSTVKSRVKKLEMPSFSKEKLFNALKDDCKDQERLSEAISCGDGTVGKAFALYSDDNLHTAINFVEDMLINMTSSKDVLRYSDKLVKEKIDVSQFLSVLELTLRDMLCVYEEKSELAFDKSKALRLKEAKGFNRGAIIYALDAVKKAVKRTKFNVNQTMLLEGLFLSILEGKFKWQKS